MKDGKKCILIADDEREIREFLQLLLTAEGYFVVTAEDGLQAQTMAEENIDLYLLDVNMPASCPPWPCLSVCATHFACNTRKILHTEDLFCHINRDLSYQSIPPWEGFVRALNENLKWMNVRMSAVTEL